MDDFPEPIRLAYVDDDYGALKGYSKLLNRDLRFTVCAEFQSVATLVSWLKNVKERPDAILLDAEYRSGSPSIGNLIRQIRQVAPEITIICLSQYGEPKIVRDAVSAGADSFLVKEDIQMAIGTAVARTCRGHFTYTPEVEPLLRDHFGRLLTQQGRIERWQWHPELTPRLKQVAGLCFLDGFSAPEAGQELGIAGTSVERHKTQVISILADGWWHDRRDLAGLEELLTHEQWSEKEGRMITIRGQLWAFHILTQPPQPEALRYFDLSRGRRDNRSTGFRLI